RTLEDHPDRTEPLPEPAVARRALRQRIVGERLHRLQLVSARGARVLVRRHGYLRIWHSVCLSANDAAWAGPLSSGGLSSGGLTAHRACERRRRSPWAGIRRRRAGSARAAGGAPA